MGKISSALFSLVRTALHLFYRNTATFASAENGKSLLWEISGNNLKYPSYYLGTMHVMCAEDAELSANVKLLIQKVGQVYMEVDLNAIDQLLPGFLEVDGNSGNSLDSSLSEDDYLKVKVFFEKYQQAIPFSVIEKQPPLMISSAIYELLLECEQKTGIEMNILQEASAAGKAIFGLETIEMQKNILNRIPYQEQADDLVKMVDNLDKYRDRMEEMVSAYKEQDIEKLYNLSESDAGVASDYLDLLLFDRNRNWVNLFSSIAEKTTTLFAVGAGHLGGQNGVLNLLKNEGYTIRPLEN